MLLLVLVQDDGELEVVVEVVGVDVLLLVLVPVLVGVQWSRKVYCL